MGRKRVAADCLAWLLQIPQVRVVGVITDNHLENSVTANVARSLEIPLYSYESAYEAINNHSLSYDLGLSMLYWRYLKGSYLNHPALGTINFHPAPLPQYKGVGGYNLAILNDESEWSVTSHFVDEKIDTGQIIGAISFPVDKCNETALSLEQKSQKALRRLFEDTLKVVLEDPDNIQTRPNEGGTYLSRQQLEALKEIDVDANDLDRKVRAFWFPPYHGAYVKIAGKKYTLVNDDILETLADPTSSSLFTKVVNFVDK